MADTKTPVEQKPPELIAAEIAKLHAEAEAALITARSEADKAAAETAKLAAEAELASHQAFVAAITVDREREKRAKELTDDTYNYVYLFDKDVSETSTKACIRQLSHWERSADDPITVNLHINSPGGSIFDGFALVDFIEGLHDRGHTVNTTAFGMAASMGGVLLQAGKTRRMGKSAFLLIHEASFGAMGSMGKIEDQVELAHLLQERILDMYADRAKASAAAKPMSRAQIKQRWQRKDWWISAPDSLKHGFIDQIV